MRDGAFITEWENGEIVSVSINPRLEHRFEKLFKSAARSSNRGVGKVEHGIKVIVFGSFWIEAFSNYCLRSFLEYSSQKSKWTKLERKKTIDKFKYLSKEASGIYKTRFSHFRGKLKDALSIRNRLAHFKEENFKIAGRVTKEEFISLHKSTPDPELIQELKNPKLKHHISVIILAGKWLRDVNEYLSFVNGVHVSQSNLKKLVL